MVVNGMRLIRRPWKGCQFWDVPFTIPWKGCKFQKWGLRKWGYRIWFFWVFNMLRVVSYDHQGGCGGARGGVLTFLTNTSFTLRKMRTLHMLSYDHRGGAWGWGWGGGALTFLTSTSLTLRKMHTLRMLLYDHRGGGAWGWGVGGGNFLDEHFPYVTEDAHVAHAVVWSSGGGAHGGGGWGVLGGGVY